MEKGDFMIGQYRTGLLIATTLGAAVFSSMTPLAAQTGQRPVFRVKVDMVVPASRLPIVKVTT